MTKRKDAIALFDLISKGKAEHTAGLSVPGWFSKRPAPTPAPGSDEPGAPQPPPAPEPSTFSPTAPYEPMVTVADSRVRVSLNYTAFGVVAVGLLVTLVFVFYLGRLSGRSSGTTPAAANAGGGRDAGYHPGPGADPNVTAFTPVARTKGKYYLVIDRLQGKSETDRLDAVAIYDYCQKNGYPCMALMYGQDRFAVLSLKPFDTRTSKEALDFARAVEDLGRKYRPPPGRNKYTFSQHSRPDKLDPTWHLE